MNLSYWEKKSWFSNLDFTIVGSGIVGLCCAISLKKEYPNATVLVIDRGVLPQGASTKNAGFACFGSLSELIADLDSHSEQEVFDLVQKRWNGLTHLRTLLGDQAIDFQQHGGHELFINEELFQECRSKNASVNELLEPIFKEKVFSFRTNSFQFNNMIETHSYNVFEGQLDTGMMIMGLLQKAQSLGVRIVNNLNVEKFDSLHDHVAVKTNYHEFKTRKLLLATNGFANELLEENIKPARAQIAITKPIKNLSLKGTFHLDRGYYYFRNINNRILIGGGRNLDFDNETTTKFGQTAIVQNTLNELLKNSLLPNIDYEIDYTWSGIMGVGDKKKAIVKEVSNNVYCGVRLGGMGVAIGSAIGKELADLV